MTSITSTNSEKHSFSVDNSKKDSQSDITAALKHQPGWFTKDPLKAECEHIDSTTLAKALSDHFSELIAEGADPLKAAEKLADRLPMEELQKAVCGNEKEALEQANEMLLQAQYYLKHCDQNLSPSLRMRLGNVIDGMLNLGETLLKILGAADFFAPSQNKWDDQAKMQKLMMLIMLFGGLSAFLVPMVGSSATPILGGSFLVVTVLSLLYPKIAPKPRSLPHAENLTQKFHKGQMADMTMSKGRQDVLDQMANGLVKNLEPGHTVKHPLLIGKSGVGKSQSIEALVQAIESGEYPALKGKTVFCINTPDLQEKGDILAGDPLVEIEKAIGRHKGNLILVFDEIHVACKKGNETLGERLKKRLDPNGGFPLIVGITTAEEYTKYTQTNTAFTRRFNPITVNDTDQAMTEEILGRAFLQMGKTSLRTNEALTQIYQKTAKHEWRQPLASRQILKDCIELTSDRQQSELAERVEGLYSEKAALCALGASSSLQFTKISTQIAQIEKEIEDLQTQIQEEKKELANLFHMKEKMNDVKHRNYRAVVKTQNCSKKVLSHELNMMMLLTSYVSPAIESYITEQAEKRKMQVKIDEKVIDQAVKAQATLLKKRDQAIKDEGK